MPKLWQADLAPAITLIPPEANDISSITPDKRPDPGFVKAYGHNGYFKSLKEIVHFYNTRDTLPRCTPQDPGEGVSCWPAPETTANMKTSKVGHLDLSDAQENAIVAFLKTLTDGWQPPPGHAAQ